jgi:predicted Rossmann fold nucleotide-binding protein DprA/Smf involved in DNA uptake
MLGSPASLNQGAGNHLIDRIRHDIQERLEQLLAEADKLRRVLAALDPRDRPAPTPPAAPAARPARPVQPRPRSPKPASARARTAPGATKTAVLGALADGSAKTAGEVAAATGLACGTVSTTLSKLAKSGEVLKADRGYRRPELSAGNGATPAAADTATTPDG